MGTPTDSQDGAPRTTSARGPLGGLAAATSLFTILPAPMIADVDRRVATRAIRAFPVSYTHLTLPTIYSV